MEKYLEIAYKFFEDYYIYLVPGLLILYALYCYLRYDIGILSRIRKSLSNINRALNEIFKVEAGNLNKINNIFDEGVHAVLNNAWDSYYMYTAYPEKAPDIRNYFNTSSVIAIPGNRKKMEAVPGIIILIGILGAFAGLIMAIRGIELSAGALTEKSLEILLQRIAEVFSILTAAISISIVLKLLDRQIYHKTAKELLNFCSLTERRIQVVRDPVNLGMLLEEQQKHTVILERISDETGDVLEDFAFNSLAPVLKQSFEESIRSFFAPSISEMSKTIVKLSQFAVKSQQEGTQKMVDAFMEKLGTATEGHLKSAETNIRTLSKFADKMGKNLEIHMDQMERIIGIHKELSETSWAIIKDMSQNHTEVLNSNKQMVQIIEKSNILADSISPILNANAEMMDKLNQQKLELQQENSQYFDNMNEQMQKIHEELNYRTNDIFTRFTDITETVINRLDENMGNAMESFEENVKSTIESLDEQSRSISLYAKELSADIGELNNNLNNSAKEFGDSIHEGVIKTFEDFDHGLAEICGRLGTTINSIKDMTEYLPELMKVFTNEIKNLRGS